MKQSELDQLCINTIRFLAVDTVQNANSGHPGMPLDAAPMAYVLATRFVRRNPADPGFIDRDRFVLSSGHASALLYSIMHLTGYEAMTLDQLKRFRQWHSLTPGHPEYHLTPGVEASTGALGHGLSYGVGMALAARIEKRDTRVIVVMGDGEINEGSVWEAALCAGKHKLNNLTAVIDYNKIQSAGPTREIQDLEPLLDKWRAFNFAAVDVDGHDVEALRKVFDRLPLATDRPSAIICHTVKGKGIAFAENDANWHHKSKIANDVVTQLYAALE